MTFSDPNPGLKVTVSLNASRGLSAIAEFLVSYYCPIYSNFVRHTHRFWDIRLQICRDLENLVMGPSRSLKMWPFDRAHITSCWRSIATMGLSRTFSEVDGDFTRKSQKFPTPMYFAPRWRGSPWNWVSAPGVRKLEWCCYRADKEIWRYLQPSG